MPRYKDGHNSHDFFEKMKQTISSYIDEERFAHAGHRYLRYLMENTQHHTKPVLKLDEFKTTPTWEQFESLFIKVTMDQQQWIDEMLKLLLLGMTYNETCQFAHIVARDV